ncbi:MAG: ABC transporter permease, partial [Planctomycetota bacterium]
MKFNPLYQLTLVKLRDLVREPEALFWVFIFPVLLAVALGIAFRSGGSRPIAVGVQAGESASWVRDVLEVAEGLEPELLEEGQARERLRTGKVALVVAPGDPWVYWF